MQPPKVIAAISVLPDLQAIQLRLEELERKDGKRKQAIVVLALIILGIFGMALVSSKHQRLYCQNKPHK